MSPRIANLRFAVFKKSFLAHLCHLQYFRCNSTDVTGSMTAEAVVKKSLIFTKMPARLVFTEHRQKYTESLNLKQGHLL
jgi:hypothetical protein